MRACHRWCCAYAPAQLIVLLRAALWYNSSNAQPAIPWQVAPQQSLPLFHRSLCQFFIVPFPAIRRSPRCLPENLGVWGRAPGRPSFMLTGVVLQPYSILFGVLVKKKPRQRLQSAAKGAASCQDRARSSCAPGWPPPWRYWIRLRATSWTGLPG